MAVIVQRLFTGGFGATDKAIQLYKEELIRPFDFGDDWTKLRVAVLMGVGNTGTVNALFDVGVCTAGNRGIGSGTPTNYVGSGMGGEASRATTPILEYGTATGGWPQSGSISGNRSVHMLTQHGSTIDSYNYSRSQGSVFTLVPNSTPTGGVYYRGMVILDLHRVSSVLVNILFYAPNTPVVGGAGIDVPPMSMMDVCESPWGVAPFSIGYNLQTLANVTVTYPQAASPTGNKAYTGSAGALNAVNINWTTSACDFTIWGIAVAKHL